MHAVLEGNVNLLCVFDSEILHSQSLALMKGQCLQPRVHALIKGTEFLHNISILMNRRNRAKSEVFKAGNLVGDIPLVLPCKAAD